ncbi:MAG: hypothetical protein NUV81_04350 [bacterium]|nr:hypothetical protein [bacterium]
MQKGNRQMCAVIIACIALIACGDSFIEIVAPGSGGATQTSTGGHTTSSTGDGGTATTGGFGGMVTTLGGSGGETTASSSGGFGGTPVMCNADEKACGNTCVKVDDPEYGCDPSACESCASKGLANVSAYVCEEGACEIATCDGAFQDCDGKVASGCEVDTAHDPDHCGSCMNVCPQKACEASICNPFCGPLKVTTQGVAICWDWQDGNPNYAMAISGIVGAQSAPAQKPLMQADNTPCKTGKTDKQLVCAFGKQPANTFLQLELIDFYGEAFYSWRCWSTQTPSFCWGVVRVWRDGVEMLPAFKDMANQAPQPWMYVQGPNGRWRIQRTIP